MLNIPTDLLRTLVSVVDLRSFTKAAQCSASLSPRSARRSSVCSSCSASRFLDKSAPGVSLTPRGEMVVGHARRMLAINDEIAQLNGSDRPPRRCASAFPVTSPASRFPQPWRSSASAGRTSGSRRRRRASKACCAGCARAISIFALRLPTASPRSRRIICGSTRRCGYAATPPSSTRPGRFRSFHSARIARAGPRRWRPSIVPAGNATSCSPPAASPASRRRCSPGSASWCCRRAGCHRQVSTIWEDAPLPELPQLYCGIYLREGGDNRAALEELADALATVLRPQLQVKTAE